MSAAGTSTSATTIPPQLQTSRLRLEFFDPAPPSPHPTDILSVYTHPTIVSAWGDLGLHSPNDVVDRCRSSAIPSSLCTKSAPPLYIYHPVSLRETGQLAGFTSVFVFPSQDKNGPTRPEIGYALLPEHHGKGYATEAVRATLKYYFEVVGVREIAATPSVENGPSRRVAEKAGGRLVGDGVEENGAFEGHVMKESQGIMTYIFTADYSN